MPLHAPAENTVSILLGILDQPVPGIPAMLKPEYAGT
jgi:hypothetical protein